MRKRHIIFGLGLALVIAGGYYLGWHTSAGRFVCGISSVEFVNRTDQKVSLVSLYLSDSDGREIAREFENLEPQHSVVVRVRTSDLILRRAVCQQGERRFAYDGAANVTRGEVYLITLDSQGRMLHAPHD